MSELRALVAPPSENLVKALEKMLEDAKSGQLQAFAGALIYRGGGVTGWRAGRARIGSVLFGLERAKLRLMGFVEDVDIELDLGGME